MPEAVAFDEPASIDLFTDEELEAYFADGEDVFGEDLGFGDDDPILGGPYDPFAEPLPGPDDTALAGRDGKRAGELMAASVDAGRDALHAAVKAAVERLLDDPDWRSATVLFDDGELKQVADAVAAARAAGDLLGRARVRRLAADAPADPVPVKFAEGFDPFDCKQCDGVAYNGDPATGTRYRFSVLCSKCGNRWKMSEVRPAAQRFAEQAPPDPFQVFAAEPVPVLPPGPAAEYFRRLVPTVGVKPERFAPLFDRHAFTMAVAADEAVLNRVKSILEDVIGAGGEPRDAKARIEDLLDNVGVSPRNPQYSDLVMRTNAMDAYVQGQQSEYADPDVAAAFPAWEYHAVKDERSRPHHAARDGRLYGPGVTFQEVRGMGPEDAINCLPPWAKVSGRITGVLKARYTGELVEVVTARGVRLTMTVNHPVLTPDGPVAAGRLRKGDDLLCYRPQPEAGTGADVQNSPARVEDLFDSFAAGAERPPVLRLDFDGDGAFMQGDIEVVRPAVRLPRDGQPAEGQSVGEVVFVPADAGGVGGADLPLPSGSGHAGPLHPLGFAPATGSDPDSPQAVVDHSTANAEVLGQCVDGTALPKQTRHLVRVDGLGHRAAHVGPAAELDVRLSQPPPNGFPFDPEFPAELLGRFAGKVAADQIVNIVRFHYDGPVYDVETEVGYFTAADGTQESILTRNCRCAWSPIHRRELERRLKAGETIHEG